MMLDGLLSIAAPLIFLAVVGVFVFVIVRGIRQFLINEASPVVTARAQVVAKRMALSHHPGTINGDPLQAAGHSSSQYFVTFELEDATRVELPLRGKAFGLLVEGDIGTLKHQGARYLGFDREI